MTFIVWPFTWSSKFQPNRKAIVVLLTESSHVTFINREGKLSTKRVGHQILLKAERGGSLPEMRQAARNKVSRRHSSCHFGARLSQSLMPSPLVI